MKIIGVLDDDRAIIELLTICLKNEGYEVRTFTDSRIALEYLLKNPVDALILDIMMPNIDGISVLKQIKEKYDYPVLLLTAKTEQTDVLTGLYSGATDYIKKPFDIAELVQRLKIHLKTGEKFAVDEEIVKYRNLYLNKSTHEFFINSNLLSLTPIEFKIIEILMQNTNKVISSEKIFESIWKEHYFERDSNTVSVHIRNIRTKAKLLGESSDFIKTIWGVGYKIE